MKSFNILRVVIFLVIIFKEIDGKHHTTVLTDVKCFSNLPDTVRVVHIDPETLIKYDNKGEHVMGVPDDKCDNGRVRKSDNRIVTILS